MVKITGDHVLTVLRVLGTCCGLTIVALGLYNLIAPVDTTLQPVVNDIYRIIFGFLIVFAEFRWNRLLVWFSFLLNFIGLGGWYIFVGGLALGDSSWEIAMAIILCSVGVIYCGLGCMCKDFNPKEGGAPKDNRV
jgi:hypothetical protein